MPTTMASLEALAGAAAATTTTRTTTATAALAATVDLMAAAARVLNQTHELHLNASDGQATATATMATMATTLATDGEAEDDAPDLILNEFVQIFFCILYTTVFVLGVFGNVLVCYVVLRNRAMQTVTNIFITNLALSDILLCVLAVPFTPLYTFMGRWAFGRTLCHLVSFAQGCSIYISTLTLTSIAIDRYFVIIYPFHPRMKLSTCIAIIVSIWVIALLATVPYGMYMKVVSAAGLELGLGANATAATEGSTTTTTTTATATMTTSRSTAGGLAVSSSSAAYMQVMAAAAAASSSDGQGQGAPPTAASTTTYCEENWPSEQYRKVFGSVTTILQFVLPFLIISICYTWVSVKLNARARAKPGSKSSRREEADRDRKKRTNRMLIAMVAVFGLSWLPLNVVNIFDDFYEKSNEWRFYTLFFFVAHSIAMSSTCYNPFLYAWLNENFRKEFKHVLPCFNPSNNNIINITRGYNRSDRNTCGPRLHNGGGGGGGDGRGRDGGGVGGTCTDFDDLDDNGVTQETTLTKDKMPIIPREATYGSANGSGAGGGVGGAGSGAGGQGGAGGGLLSPALGSCASSALVHGKRVDILLNDSRRCGRHRGRSCSGYNKDHDDDDYEDDDDDDGIDSGDEEQTVEMRFVETPFVSSDNTTGISMMETSTSNADNTDRSHLQLHLHLHLQDGSRERGSN